jgi:AAA15 family ATPase/GTPase
MDKSDENRSFKLIAIRPLKGCHKNLIKSLTPNKIYKFYSNYEFTHVNEDENDIVIDILSKPSPLDELFYVNRPDGTTLPVNISAVVGKNGSGKSTLLELFYLSVYLIGIETGLLKRNLAFLEAELSGKQDDISKLNSLTKEKKDLEWIYKNFACEIYYELDEEVWCLPIQSKLKSNKATFKLKSLNGWTLYKEFFYSIAINYSIYSLNSLLVGNWINQLFHKNDGYQTPLVINPFRKEGNINVNLEFYLAKQRLLANLLNITSEKTKEIELKYDEKLQLTDAQHAKNLIFKLNTEKIKYAYKTELDEEISFETIYTYNFGEDQVWATIYDNLIERKRSDIGAKFKDELEKYILKKIIQIATTYPGFFGHFDDSVHLIPIQSKYPTALDYKKVQYRFEYFELLLQNLKKDRSHVTFKLHQAVNCLKGDLLRDDTQKAVFWSNDNKDNPILRVSINEMANRIRELKIDDSNTIHLIPPPLFDIEIELCSDEKPENTSNFSALSSGQQHLIYTIHGIIYHLNNVNSVFYNYADGKNRITYKKIKMIR